MPIENSAPSTPMIAIATSRMPISSVREALRAM